jgi:hypothetical protein
MVVGESKHFQNLFGVDHVLENISPIFQIASTVNDNFVPSLRLRFNAFAVA